MGPKLHEVKTKKKYRQEAVFVTNKGQNRPSALPGGLSGDGMESREKTSPGSILGQRLSGSTGDIAKIRKKCLSSNPIYRSYPKWKRPLCKRERQSDTKASLPCFSFGKFVQLFSVFYLGPCQAGTTTESRNSATVLVRGTGVVNFSEKDAHWRVCSRKSEIANGFSQRENCGPILLRWSHLHILP